MSLVNVCRKMTLRSKVKGRRIWKIGLLCVAVILLVNSAMTLLLSVPKNRLFLHWGKDSPLKNNISHQNTTYTLQLGKHISSAIFENSFVSSGTILCKHTLGCPHGSDGEKHLNTKEKASEQLPVDCENLYAENIITKDQEFQRIEDNDSMFVVSAFYDEGRVRIIGVSDKKKVKAIFCRLWYERTEENSKGSKIYRATTVNGHMEIFHASPLRYQDAFFFCPVDKSSVPIAVSLLTDKCQSAINSLEILNRNQTDYKVTFTVCLKPFHFHYSKVFALVEWIEFNIMLGAEYFTFYNHSSDPKLNTVLEWYSKRGLAEVIQWPAPMRVQGKREIEYAGQIIAQNDCHYRNRFKSKYTVQIDVDELIIPRRKTQKTWAEVFANLPEADMYTFRNTFFKLEWTDTNISFDGKDTAASYGLNTLLKLVREEKIFPAYQRSKYIARTDGVSVVNIHDAIAKHRNKFVVPVEDGLVHHYRNWENPGDPKERKTDTTVLKYKDVLIKNVKEAWANIKSGT